MARKAEELGDQETAFGQRGDGEMLPVRLPLLIEDQARSSKKGANKGFQDFRISGIEIEIGIVASKKVSPGGRSSRDEGLRTQDFISHGTTQKGCSPSSK